MTPKILSIPGVNLNGTNIVQLLGLLSCTACRLVSSNSVGFFARNCGLVTLGKMFMWEAQSKEAASIYLQKGTISFLAIFNFFFIFISSELD